MADHTEINEFFEEILHTIINVVPQHADIENHIIVMRASIEKHSAQGDKYAKDMQPLTNADLEKLIRFVERPHGRHHISEIEKLWKDYGAETAGRQFLKHFYEHNSSQLEHAEGLKKIK